MACLLLGFWPMLVQAACSPQPDCEAYYVATFISQSVPTTMVAGQSYAVSIQMENDGSRTWFGPNDGLGSQNPIDNMTWGLNRVGVPSSIAELGVAVFNFTVQAPSTPGTYNFRWRMNHGSVWFGDLTPNVVVTVINSNNPPSITLTAPTNGASAAAPASFTLTANASDSDGSISKVEFKSNGVLIGSPDTVPPYSVTYSNVAVGTYTLTATATDNLGATATSTATVTVTNPPPTVTLTAPANGATATAPATFTLTANASDSNGSISKVEFKSNGVLIGSPDTSAPYSVTYSNVAAGTYAITAVATDNDGATTTSNTATVTVNAAPPSLDAQFISQSVPASMIAGQTYPVSVQMKNTGTATWTAATAFKLGSQNPQDNQTWGMSRNLLPASIAPGQTATFNFNVMAPATTGTYNFQWRMVQESVAWFGSFTTNVAVIVNPNPPPTVTLTAPANGASTAAPGSFTLTANASDSNGTISKVEFKSNGVLIGSPDTTSPYSVTYSNVAAGTYTLTAVATDNLGAATTSSAVTVTVTNPPPTVTLTAPANGATATAPASFTLTANASDSNGTISKVEFKSNGVLIGSPDTTSPYSVTLSNVAAGTYTFTAVATDNLGATTTSTAATVTVTGLNAPPAITLTAPASGSTASAPASFTLTANASDSDGSISKVEFKSNGVLIGSPDTSAPYSVVFSNVAAGTYALTAVATDNSGATTTSNTATVTVTPTTVTQTRSYKYDANERLCKSIDPEVGATIIDYDLASNVAWTAPSATLLDPSQCNRMSVSGADKTLRSYDAMNRVIAVTTPGSTADLSYTYAPDGLVTQVTASNPGNATVTTTYAYYKRRLLQQETVSQPSASFTLGYSYTGNGHLSTLTYPDNQVVAYAPNALGQATQVGSYATGVTYYPNGAIQQFSYGNGVVHTMTQNARRLPARSRDVKGAAVVLDDSYNFDANGNVTDITDQAQAGLTTRGMAYDGLDRLTVAVAPGLWGNASYGYDALDNLRKADQGTRQYRYVYDAQLRLSQITNPAGTPQITLGYDVRGNVTNKNSQAFVFDASNRLNQVTGQETYRYDGQGRRVQTTDADGKTTFWIYSQSGQVMYTSEARRNQNLAYLYLGNTQVATRAVAWGSGTETIRYQHTDALGSPVAETDTGGVVTKRNTYAPYGEAYGATNIDGTGYTGHVMDRATGLTYMQQRYYDPVIGRFLSIDPMAVDTATASNFNRYWYANNNPYKFTDPDGREAGGGYATGQYTMAQPSPEGAGLVADFLPVIGDIKGAVEAFQDPTPANIVGAGAGVVPVVGDFAAKVIKDADKIVDATKRFSKEKEALVDMAQADKKAGITTGDMQAYKDLNAGLPDPFDSKQVRGPEAHLSGAPTSQEPHGHVGPVDHIPIKDK